MRAYIGTDRGVVVVLLTRIIVSWVWLWVIRWVRIFMIVRIIVGLLLIEVFIDRVLIDDGIRFGRRRVVRFGFLIDGVNGRIVRFRVDDRLIGIIRSRILSRDRSWIRRRKRSGVGCWQRRGSWRWIGCGIGSWLWCWR